MLKAGKILSVKIPEELTGRLKISLHLKQMNYLAHLFLSGEAPEIRVGNFIGDYVKGNSYNKFSPKIQKGILLHRRIDEFTDKHPVVKRSSVRLNSHYGRYSGIVIDMFYDHFLAANWKSYSEVELSEYVTSVHRLLMFNYFKLPARVKRFLPFLIKSRRLENYRHISGIERSLQTMSNFTSLPAKTGLAIEVLENYYEDFNTEFKEFFPDIIKLSEEILMQDT